MPKMVSARWSLIGRALGLVVAGVLSVAVGFVLVRVLAAPVAADEMRPMAGAPTGSQAVHQELPVANALPELTGSTITTPTPAPVTPTPAPATPAPAPATPAPTAGPQPDADQAAQPTPAAHVETSSRGGDRPTPDISSPDKFIAAVAQAAQDAQEATKVPASVTIAQAILESDWGQSLLAKKANNFFGIKAQSGPGPAGVITMDTWEVLSGGNVVVPDAFRAYHDLYESVMDHGQFLADNPRYAAAFQALDDPAEFARRIAAAGYATDPAYASKLTALIQKFGLDKYDAGQ